MVSTKIYVGNLPWTFSNDQLSNAFIKHGDVISAKVVTDKESGRSKGFGFVEMGNETEAGSAIKAMNGSEVEGRKIVVAAAKSN